MEFENPLFSGGQYLVALLLIYFNSKNNTKIIYFMNINYLENCPWANTRPSRRIGNLTSQLPTMF